MGRTRGEYIVWAGRFGEFGQGGYHARMNTTTRSEVASWVLAAVTLLMVLQVKLLAALIGGLVAHELLHSVSPAIRISGASLRARKRIMLLLMLVVLSLLGTVVGVLATTLGARGPESLAELMQRMADLIEGARPSLPEWIQAYIPASATELQSTASGWLRTHAGELRTMGQNFGRGLTHLLLGIIIGALVAFSHTEETPGRLPLAAALCERAELLGRSFRRLVFAQVRISALNTLLTGVFLAVVLPLLGVHLPLVKTMIAVTFLAGLMPLVGNLISNTVIMVVSLGHSLGAAAGSLMFLITIHKLEYLINAQIIGTQMRARAWELLMAMLVMESLFGLPGLVAAPIFYGYLKDELATRRLV